jgi:hypothetical protein
MDVAQTARSFKYLALSLIVVGFAVSYANPLARARDPVAPVRGPGAMTVAARPLCDAVTPGCSITSPSRNTGRVPAPSTVSEPLVAHGRSRGIAPPPHLQIQLQLQRNLFTRGGRLDPVDLLVGAAAASPPTERTERVPAWATELRAERMKIEKEGS